MKLSNLKFYLKGMSVFRSLQNTPVIVGGCERSGTTLFQSMISAHPEIFAIEEEAFSFCHGPPAGFNSKNPIRITRLFKALGSNDIPDTCNRWCEKTPANVFYFNDILKYFKNKVRLIYIIRDGRDVVSSMHPDNPSQPWVSIDRWVKAAEEGFKFKDNEYVLTIKYEDLITDFDTTIHRVCEHIGVNPNKEILNWYEHASIKKSVNLIGGSVKKLSKKSLHKYLQSDFKYQHIVDEFMENERAVFFLKYYGYC